MAEITPSENEWLIMEVIWDAQQPMTAAEIIQALNGTLEISQKTIRVMINRLVAKGMLMYSVDEKDARIYHYTAGRSREECRKLKSQRFLENYFSGNTTLAVASFLKSADVSKEELEELENILKEMKK